MISEQHARIPDFGVLKNWVSVERRSTFWRALLSSFRSTFYRRIIRLLIQARKDAGITQTELGKRMGQRQTFISKIELEERRLDAAELIAVSRAMEIDPYALMKRAEDDK